GDVVAVQVTALDWNALALTYSATRLPAGVSLDPHSGLISGTIASGIAVSNPFQVIVTVTDGTLSDSEAFGWQVSALGPVSLALMPDQLNAEGDVVSLQVSALSQTGVALAYSGVGLPAGLSIDEQSGLISGTIATGIASADSYQVMVIA